MASQDYLNLLDEAKELHIKKNAGYAGADNPDAWANFREADELGVSAFRGCLVRMSDKYVRVKNLLKDPRNEKVGESLEDTLKDLSAYALIAVCLLREQNKKQTYATTLTEAPPRTYSLHDGYYDMKKDK